MIVDTNMRLRLNQKIIMCKHTNIRDVDAAFACPPIRVDYALHEARHLPRSAIQWVGASESHQAGFKANVSKSV